MCILRKLVRYIHLNPLRAGIAKDLKELKGYQWCGHSGIMGRVKREWQDMDYVPGYFGRTVHRGKSPDVKRPALELYLEGLGFRSIGRFLKR